MEDYCFALNLGVSESFVFARVSFFLYENLFIAKLTVLAKIVHVDPSYQTLKITVFNHYLSFNCNHRI